MGAIAIKLPLPPGFMATLWKNDAGFERAYMDRFPGYYAAGDAGFVDGDGYVHVMTRTDDVINVSGRRLSTGALEEAVAAHPNVVESAVFGVDDALRGAVPVALLVTTGAADDAAVVREAKTLVRDRVGAFAALADAAVVAALPKTRSGKILRNALRALANGQPVQLPGTVEDAAVLDDHARPALAALGYPRGGGAAETTPGRPRAP